MIIDIKSSLKQTYNNHAQEREKNEMQEWKARPRQTFLTLLQKENKRTLLEIGAGHGRDSKFFKDNNLEVVAVDLSDEMVKLCREKGIEAYEHDFYNLSGINRRFDAVWAMNCLLHVEKDRLGSVLNEISLVLNTSGLYFMGVYGGFDEEGIWEDDTYTPKRFFSFYTDDSILKVVKNYFDIVRFEKIDTGGKYYFQSMILRKKGVSINEI